jgi:hypothetical protein
MSVAMGGIAGFMREIARAIAEEVVPAVPDRLLPKIVEEVRNIVDGEPRAGAREESSRGTW